ncbi:hypothetical protein RhiirA1_537427 [Rhizophagus irregularis]|uniref:SAM domain-containing protein n=1 Tax=Rhizophagus irregularis TaxID=588596 RepID=A0A2N0RKU6_9GLOM|nr:hypothetical protein RhiirA1_537427 [Rhizophagus irregularis]
MSETSTPYTPASTSTTVAGNETLTLADEVKKYDTEGLISFFRSRDLGLSENAIKILEKEEIDGQAFLKLGKEEFRSIGLGLGPAVKLADFAKECKDKKLRSFSLYKTKKELGEVLRKYGIDSNDIKKIPPFVPEPVKIDEAGKHFQYCITDIKRKMGIIGSAKSSNEAVRCSYIEAILLSAMYIVKDITRKRISLEPQFEVVGEEATGRVDYAIKKIIDSLNEELICITEGKQNQEVLGIMQNIMQLESSYHTNKRKRKASEAFDDDFDYLYGIVTTAIDWYFIMYTPERVYCTKADYHIDLTEDILEDDAKLRQGVKEVMRVIVGLLKDRVEVADSPDIKRARTEKYIKE